MHFDQNEAVAARRRFPLFLVLASDGLSPATMEAGGQPQLSKNGSAWVNTAATLVHVGNGTYYVELSVAELDTLGHIQVRYKGMSTAEFSVPADVGLGLETAAEVWAYASRTLTQDVEGITQIVSGTAGSRLRIRRGDSVVLTIAGLGSLVGRTALYWTVKADRDDTDAQALLQVSEAGGLLRLNGAAATPGQASLVVADEVAGDITITLDELATAQLVASRRREWDVQVVNPSGVATPGEGDFQITGDVTRATS